MSRGRVQATQVIMARFPRTVSTYINRIKANRRIGTHRDEDIPSAQIILTMLQLFMELDTSSL